MNLVTSDNIPNFCVPSGSRFMFFRILLLRYIKRDNYESNKGHYNIELENKGLEAKKENNNNSRDFNNLIPYCVTSVFGIRPQPVMKLFHCVGVPCSHRLEGEWS